MFETADPVWHARSRCLGDVGAAIGGPVIDQEQLPPFERLREYALDGLGQEGARVEERHYDRDRRVRTPVRHPAPHARAAGPVSGGRGVAAPFGRAPSSPPGAREAA